MSTQFPHYCNILKAPDHTHTHTHRHAPFKSIGYKNIREIPQQEEIQYKMQIRPVLWNFYKRQIMASGPHNREEKRLIHFVPGRPTMVASYF